MRGGIIHRFECMQWQRGISAQHDEDNKPERKFNLRDAVIYSEIMKTKFDE